MLDLPVAKNVQKVFISPLYSISEARYSKKMKTTLRPAHASPTPKAWYIGVAFVLALMVGMVSFTSMERHETTMTRLLAEKGDSLILAFENILRTGMRSQMGLRVQVLLEEMSASPDIHFIAVTMPDGTIVAHSNPARLGEILQIDDKEIDEATMTQWRDDTSRHWRITTMEGRRAFVVYQTFSPLRRQFTPALPQPMIFLGLDVSPFESSRNQDRNQALLMAMVIMLVGMASLLALYYAQHARISRQRQRFAEGQVRLLEEEMRRKEKLAAVGSLAAGVAHEIRNPLSSIKGYATYFGQRFPEGSEDREAAHVMVCEVDRLNRVITDLIGLSRPTDVHVIPTDLRAVAAHALQLFKQDAEQRGVTLKLEAPASLPLAAIDPDRIKQAVLNLCLNALDAMPKGGVLTLSLAKEGGRLRLRVTDTGIGMTPELLKSIFNPYFTTKGNGTGMGLAIVHKIIEAHGGEIDVTSRLATEKRGGQTSFTLWLPEAGKP